MALACIRFKQICRFILLTWLMMIMPFCAYAEKNGLINIHKEFLIFKHAFKFNPKLLKLALEAYDCGIYYKDANSPGLLTIVDYQLPSYDKRLWVLDLYNNKILYHTWVAHGAGSGGVDAKTFSNIIDSYDSSLGLYKTGVSYFGEWGYAMRLKGLEPHFNGNVYRRHIVMHGGKYVSKKAIKKYGMIGMSHGCLAVPVTLDHDIIDTLRGGSLIFAYYPKKKWLRHSKFLHCPILRKMHG